MTNLTKNQATPTLQANDLGSAPARRVTAENRIPMSLPTMKLSVPKVDGHFLYWHLGKNVPNALRAGYTHVESGDLDVEQKNVATPAGVSGSTDMGTNISVSAGVGLDENFQPERLYLMKLPNEWRERDLAAHEEISETTARSLRAGMIGAEEDPDRNKRYMKQGQDLFYPKRPKV
jgi:hypothetical protein